MAHFGECDFTISDHLPLFAEMALGVNMRAASLTPWNESATGIKINWSNLTLQKFQKLLSRNKCNNSLISLMNVAEPLEKKTQAFNDFIQLLCSELGCTPTSLRCSNPTHKRSWFDLDCRILKECICNSNRTYRPVMMNLFEPECPNCSTKSTYYFKVPVLQ